MPHLRAHGFKARDAGYPAIFTLDRGRQRSAMWQPDFVPWDSVRCRVFEFWIANTNLRTVENFEKLHSLLIGYLGLSSLVVLL